jgi:hypothetical protein
MRPATLDLATLTGAILISAILPATAADLRRTVIQDIHEAGIYNCEGGPDDLGPRFYELVRQSCIGRTSCEVSATDVASEGELKSFGCTNFFAIAICDAGDLQEYTSTNLSERLFVFCDSP